MSTLSDISIIVSRDWQGSGFPVARGQPKDRRASQSHIMAGPVGQP